MLGVPGGGVTAAGVYMDVNKRSQTQSVAETNDPLVPGTGPDTPSSGPGPGFARSVLPFLLVAVPRHPTSGVSSGAVPGAVAAGLERRRGHLSARLVAQRPSSLTWTWTRAGPSPAGAARQLGQRGVERTCPGRVMIGEDLAEKNPSNLKL